MSVENRKYLVFEAYAPIASFGAPASGARRGSEQRPSRSLILGLIGAALGVDRADADGQVRLGRLGVASVVLALGQPFDDYHTTAVPSASALRASGLLERAHTRRDELAIADKTVLSTRSYVTDALVRIAVWVRGEQGQAVSLEDIAAAFDAPRYALSLGRKSCALGLPLSARLVEAADVVAALHEYQPVNAAIRAAALRRSGVSSPEVAGDRDGFPGGLTGYRVEEKRDDPVDRVQWLFASREELVAPFDGADRGI